MKIVLQNAALVITLSILCGQSRAADPAVKPQAAPFALSQVRLLDGPFYDAMIRVPPQSVQRLTYEELKVFGLAENDPVQQEMDDASEASRYGISKQELFHRKSQVERECRVPADGTPT